MGPNHCQSLAFALQLQKAAFGTCGKNFLDLEPETARARYARFLAIYSGPRSKKLLFATSHENSYLFIALRD